MRSSTRSAPLPPPSSAARWPLDRTHTPRAQVFLVTEERWLTRMSTYVSETYKGPLKIEVIVVDEVTRAPAAALALTLAPAAALALTLAPAAALTLTLALASSLSLSLSLTRSRGRTPPPEHPSTLTEHPHQGAGSAEALRKLTPKLHRLGLGLRLRVKG